MPAKKRTTDVTFDLEPSNLPKLTAKEAAQLDAAPIDYTDVPKIPAGFWDRHRPAEFENKAQITLRLDQDVLDFFKKGGRH
jgi:uncharacterized protein (DUF4415 family)